MKYKLAVIGYPLNHSLSPVMHKGWLEEEGLLGTYEKITVKPEQLADIVQKLKWTGYTGFNVTAPHKVAILEYLDEVDSIAQAIGAVNTVIVSGEKLIGYNTDGLGFLRGAEEAFGAITQKSILLLGAGGASKAIYHTCKSKGITNIQVANRTKKPRAISLTEAEQTLNEYDMIINTTTVGMFPEEASQPITLNKANKNTIVIDIIYNPFETKLLKQAKQLGLKTQNGLPMLIHQGAIAFGHWTGIKPSTKSTIETLTNLLK